jgi:hypothetical protein
MGETVVGADVEGRESNPGGAAPEHRRCRMILESGVRCGNWDVRGQGLCVRHGRWQMTERGRVTVPLMEDEASIQLVISQTVRAMAIGALPPANGRVILAGCREARLTLHEQRWTRWLERKSSEEKGVAEPQEVPEPQEVVAHCGTWLSPAQPAEEAAAECAAPAESVGAVEDGAVEEEACEAAQELELVGACGEATDLCAEEDPTLAFGHWPDTSRDRPPTPWDNADDPPEHEPLAEFVRVPRFRDLKRNWDDALARFESDGLDMYVKKSSETWEEYYAALAKPYEAYFETKPAN